MYALVICSIVKYTCFSALLQQLTGTELAAMPVSS